METNWFIKLHRKITDWEWYRDIPTKVLFIHLLAKVNFTEKKWQGRDIKKWEIITSLDRLSNETGLTVMQVRTALTKLKSTSEVTSKSTSTFTHIQLTRWEQYQSSITSEVTNQQQTDNKPITTTKEGNKEKKERIDTEIVASTKNPNEEYFEKIQTDTESVIDTMNIPDEHRDRAKQELFKFWNYWTEKDMRWKERWRKEKTFEVQRRLTTWLMNTKSISNQKSYDKPKFTR